MLTARSEEPDRIVGLTIGADDYLTKPFSPRELVARVKAILRRIRGAGGSDAEGSEDALVFPTFRVDPARFEVWRGADRIELTPLEFNLLRELASHHGMVLSREQLIERVWGYDFYGETRVVDVHIGHLRQKVEPDPANPQYVLTVRGVGYKFEDR
jgi:two-component system alkaline phosphatase synthesis response regulator PhoP